MSQPADGSCGTFGVTLRRFSAESKHDTHTIKSFSPPAHFPLIPELSFPWIWVWIRFRFRAVCCGPSCELLVEFFLVLFFFCSRFSEGPSYAPELLQITHTSHPRPPSGYVPKLRWCEQRLICTIDFSSLEKSHCSSLPRRNHPPGWSLGWVLVNFMRIFSLPSLSARLYRNLLCLFNWIWIAATISRLSALQKLCRSVDK